MPYRKKVRIVGGSCGNTLIRITDHLRDWINDDLGYDCQVDHQNIWQSWGPPPLVDVILQTMPAYFQSDTEIPIVYIKPLILNQDDPETLLKIRIVLEKTFGLAPNLLE